MTIDTTWRKATRSNNGGNCVEVRLALDANWRKATRSNNCGGCVQALAEGAAVLLRDSKYLRDPANDPARQPVITVPAHDWPTFLSALLGDAEAVAHLPACQRTPDGGASLRAGSAELRFTAGEWEAFTGGVVDGEFELPVAATA